MVYVNISWTSNRLTCLQVGIAQLLDIIILHAFHVVFKAHDVLSSTSRYYLTNIQNLLTCIGELCGGLLMLSQRAHALQPWA